MIVERASLFVSLFVFMLGIFGSFGCRQKPIVHNVSVVNGGGARLNRVNVRFGDAELRPGILSPGAEKEFLFFDVTLTDAAVFSYETLDGKPVTNSIALRELKRAHPVASVSIRFAINSDSGDITTTFHDGDLPPVKPFIR